MEIRTCPYCQTKNRVQEGKWQQAICAVCKHRLADTLYDVLGVPQTATAQELKKAYHQQILHWHPDHNPDNPQAMAIFQSVHEAYHILSNPASRRAYDSKLKAKTPTACRTSHSSHSSTRAAATTSTTATSTASDARARRAKAAKFSKAKTPPKSDVSPHTPAPLLPRSLSWRMGLDVALVGLGVILFAIWGFAVTNGGTSMNGMLWIAIACLAIALVDVLWNTGKQRNGWRR